MSINKTLELYKGQTFSEPLEAERWIYRQALKDMMEKVRGVTCYAVCCECYMTDDFFTLESLKEIAEDLGGK